jgi:type VI secretion system secreted protein VgrG
MELPDLDIRTAIITIVAIMIFFMVISLWSGIRRIQKARALKFFRMRRDRMVSGWRLIFIAAVLLGIAWLTNQYAEPVLYNYFPPSVTPSLTPTITQTPTITLTPTMTLSPTITLTPSETDTPTITPTPHIPLAVEVLFESVVTPNPETVFSPLVFTQELDENFQPVAPDTVFQNPVGQIFAQFSYDLMSVNAQWTALWYRAGELVHFETKPWDGGTGGIGYSDWAPSPQEWIPGEYEVQIFVGLDWKISGRFLVEGELPTPLPSDTATRTATGTRTSTATRTSTITPGPSPTPTASDTFTPRPPSPTPTSTLTRAPTPTQAPPTATLTRAPTPTQAPPTITLTNAPTWTSTPTNVVR